MRRRREGGSGRQRRPTRASRPSRDSRSRKLSRHGRKGRFFGEPRRSRARQPRRDLSPTRPERQVPTARPARQRPAGRKVPGTTFALALALLFGGVAALTLLPRDEGAQGATDAAARTFNTGLVERVNPSGRTGGTLRFVLPDEPDSMDPGNTSFPYNWNFTRLYARPLLSYAPSPGEKGLTLVPDLARGLGRPSDGGRTWTYKLRKGIRYEDGREVTARHVEYAVARSNYTGELVDGPHYFAQYLEQGTYKGPYKQKDLHEFPGVTTPDRYTVVFHLTEPFAEFDFLVAHPQTAPVPPRKDTRARYQEHPLSTGPYEFAAHRVGRSLTLVRNGEWDPATDTVREQLVDRIVVRQRVAPSKVDEMLLSGDADIALDGTGLSSAMPQVLDDPELKGRADSPFTGYTRYAMISTKVPPFDDVRCRAAVQHAADRVALHEAWGGSTGGKAATTVLPPNVLGHEGTEPWDAGPRQRGNLPLARSALADCGKAEGFSTNIAVRGDLPMDVATAEALKRSLARVGIRASIRKFPSSSWSAKYAGRPSFVHEHGLGIVVAGWGADWPSGYSFLSRLVAGDAIRKSGNFNQMELDHPKVDRLLGRGIRTLDTDRRNEIWAEVDKEVMESAAFLPVVYERTLLYRPADLTNVYVHPAYGMYDYAVIGKR